LFGFGFLHLFGGCGFGFEFFVDFFGCFVGFGLFNGLRFFGFVGVW